VLLLTSFEKGGGSETVMRPKNKDIVSSLVQIQFVHYDIMSITIAPYEILQDEIHGLRFSFRVWSRRERYTTAPMITTEEEEYSSMLNFHNYKRASAVL